MSRVQVSVANKKMVLSCKFCSYRCKLRLNLIKHCLQTHSLEYTFRFRCGIKGCLHCFTVGATFSSFKTHANRKHPNWQDYVNDPIPSVNELPFILDEESIPPVTELPSTHEEPVTELSLPLTHDDEDSIYKEFDNIGGEGQSTQHVAARFLINFQEQYKLSQRAINFAVGSINTIVGSVLTSVQSTVEAAMLTETDLTSSFTFEDPFKSLKTEHQQSKFYREEFGLVVGSL